MKDDNTPVNDMSRRSFLTGLASVGGLVAASRLPSFGEDRPELFPERGRWERLSINCHHVDAGATKPFSILHISDTHLTAVGPQDSEWAHKTAERRIKTFGGRQEEALRDSLAWAKQHVDYVLHTGDLIDFQSEANFELARKYYGVGGDAMFGSLGNHEFYYGQRAETDDQKAQSSARLAAAYPFDISFNSTVVNGVNFITIDDVYGTVSQAQVDRFKAEAAKGMPMVLCMHCPFGLPAINRACVKFWRRDKLKEFPDARKYRSQYKDAVTRDFVAYLKELPQLKAILAGHLHIDVQDRFSPTAIEYLVAGNFLFHGAEITFS